MDYYNPQAGAIGQGISSMSQSIGAGMQQGYQNAVARDAVVDARNERAKQQQSLGKGAEAIANGLGDTFYNATGITPDEFKAMGSLDKYQTVKGFSDSQAIKQYVQQNVVAKQQADAAAAFQSQLGASMQPAAPAPAYLMRPPDGGAGGPPPMSLSQILPGQQASMANQPAPPMPSYLQRPQPPQDGPPPMPLSQFLPGQQASMANQPPPPGLTPPMGASGVGPRPVDASTLFRIGAQTGALATPQFAAAAQMEEKVRPTPAIAYSTAPNGQVIALYNNKATPLDAVGDAGSGEPQFYQDPVTGTRFVKSGKTLIPSGIDPDFAQQPPDGNKLKPLLDPQGQPIKDMYWNPATKKQVDMRSGVEKRGGAADDDADAADKITLKQLLSARDGGWNRVNVDNNGFVHQATISAGEPVETAISRIQGRLNASVAPVKVNSVEDWKALPSGTKYIGPNGVKYLKR